MSNRRVVIVGAGLAGLRTAEELRRAGFDGEVVLIGNENHLPYDRPPLSKEVIRGEKDQTTLKPAEFFDDKQIDLRTGVAATGVDAAAKKVRLEDGSSIDFDDLIIATGLRPRRIPGFDDLAGVHVLRSMEEAMAMRAELREGARALVVGAGFIGCELAASFRALRVHVVLVEPQPTPLASVLGEKIGGLIARMHTDEGVDVRCGVGVESLVGEDRVRAAKLSDGSEVDLDLVVVGIGSVPVTDWLVDSGIELAEPSAGGGVLADERGRTNIDSIWAVGDVAAWTHTTGKQKRVEHWTNAGDQARVLAKAIVGAEIPSGANVPYFWSDQYDIKIQALGTPSADDTVHLVEDDGRRFLAYYERDGVFTAVVGGGVPSKVMKLRAKLATPTPIADVLS
ncbi:NAD(P)/FAD-dependent oxidoreductase [Skermania sp. ID1734]|uniref:NAD(P)/FAD-dependent oxidoreductase n=1 Tax=Skermania sp. ID1734 TaxID=2597516 RepID=UPI002103CBF6|nr:FAD-dependent oxidoreductase [Skermania sp. ID1734]